MSIPPVGPPNHQPATEAPAGGANGAASPETVALAHWSALRRHIDNWYADFDIFKVPIK